MRRWILAALRGSSCAAASASRRRSPASCSTMREDRVRAGGAALSSVCGWACAGAGARERSGLRSGGRSKLFLGSAPRLDTAARPPPRGASTSCHRPRAETVRDAPRATTSVVTSIDALTFTVLVVIKPPLPLHKRLYGPRVGG